MKCLSIAQLTWLILCLVLVHCMQEQSSQQQQQQHSEDISITVTQTKDDNQDSTESVQPSAAIQQSSSDNATLMVPQQDKDSPTMESPTMESRFMQTFDPSQRATDHAFTWQELQEIIEDGKFELLKRSHQTLASYAEQAKLNKTKQSGSWSAATRIKRQVFG